MNTIKVSDGLHAKLLAAFNILEAAGVARVQFEFSGCGDEGAIDSISFLPEGATAPLNESELTNLAVYLLSEYGYNWADGEGSVGRIFLHIQARSFFIDLNQFERTTHQIAGKGFLHG